MCIYLRLVYKTKRLKAKSIYKNVMKKNLFVFLLLYPDILFLTGLQLRVCLGAKSFIAAGNNSTTVNENFIKKVAKKNITWDYYQNDKRGWGF
jgi:hypothetical protein